MYQLVYSDSRTWLPIWSTCHLTWHKITLNSTHERCPLVYSTVHRLRAGRHGQLYQIPDSIVPNSVAKVSRLMPDPSTKASRLYGITFDRVWCKTNRTSGLLIPINKYYEHMLQFTAQDRPRPNAIVPTMIWTLFFDHCCWAISRAEVVMPAW